MKTFSDLLATKQTLNLSIVLSPLFQTIVPEFSYELNGQTILSEKLTSVLTLNTKLDLLAPINIKIALLNKNYNLDHSTAIVIQRLAIDQLIVNPSMGLYTNDQNFQNPTNHLGFNGVWELDIHQPFYQWLHQITNQGWLFYQNTD